MLTARQLTEWKAYESLDPIGDQRADLRACIVAAAVINANPYRPKNSKPVKPADLMPFLESGPKRPQTHEEMKAAILRGFGIKPKRKN